MRNLINITLLLSVLAQLCQAAFASEIAIISDADISSSNDTFLKSGADPIGLYLLSDTPSAGYSFLLSGVIQKGDAEKLAKAVMQQPNPFNAVLNLDSPGGDVIEALHIASFVKAFHLITFVAGGGSCASACFFIFLDGDRHLALGTQDGRRPKSPTGYIGLHRPYLKFDPNTRNGSSDAEAQQHNLMQKTSAYLRNQNVPQRLIDLMMSRPSNDIYWLAEDDVEQLGIYSPGREELLISRCGYSRTMLRNPEIFSQDAEVAVRAATRAAALAKSYGECERTAFPDLIKETLTNTDRLRKGWRPWLESKVVGKRNKRSR